MSASCWSARENAQQIEGERSQLEARRVEHKAETGKQLPGDLDSVG
ncbi:MAG: hypothetical protein U0T02_05950 [Solirubrobacteraceae bacterium]